MRKEITTLFVAYKQQSKIKNLMLILLLCCTVSLCFGQNANDCIPASTLINTTEKKCYGSWYVCNTDSRIQYRVRGPIKTSNSALTYNKSQQLYRWDIEFKYTGTNAICAGVQEYEGNINNFATKSCYFPNETHTDECYTLSNKTTISINIKKIVEYSLEPNGTANAIFDKKRRAWYKILSKEEKNNETNPNTNIGNKQNGNNTAANSSIKSSQTITSLEQIASAGEESLRKLTDDQLKDFIVKWFTAFTLNTKNIHRDNDFLYVDNLPYTSITIPFSYMSYPPKPVNQNDMSYLGMSNGSPVHVTWQKEDPRQDETWFWPGGISLECGNIMYENRPDFKGYISYPMVSQRDHYNPQDEYSHKYVDNNKKNYLYYNAGYKVIKFSAGNTDNKEIIRTLIRLLNLKEYNSNEVFKFSNEKYLWFSTEVDEKKKGMYLYTGKTTNNPTTSNNKQNGSIQILEKKVDVPIKKEVKKASEEIEIINSNNLAKTTSLSKDALIYVAKEYDENKDFKNALEYYEAAAIKGDVDAMLWVGKCYYHAYYSSGCKDAKSYILNDYKKAKFWLEKGANLDYLGFIEELGHMYNYFKDGENALLWFKKALDKKSWNAMDWIASIYCQGCGSVKKDPYLAKEWWSKACVAGNKDCCIKLGLTSHYGCD